jgi:hypothetical protein
MNLNVPERMVALSILPREGSYSTLKILNDLRLSLSFTEEEYKEFGIVNDEEKRQVSWEKNVEIEIPIGEKATDIIVDALKRLNKEERLPENGISLYEKFIPTTE